MASALISFHKKMVSPQASLVSEVYFLYDCSTYYFNRYKAHIMRLLATHHFLREISPDVFALNRLSSLVDSGKTFEQITDFENQGR